MEKVEQLSTCFIELDCLLDTRIGTLMTHFGKEQVYDTLSSEYHEREFDIFPNVDYNTFQELYQRRDRSVLKNSIRTIIFSVINDFIQGTFNNAINSPFVFVPKIIVNVYPYKLVEEEKNLIRNMVISLTKQLSDVEVVDMDYSSITPIWVKKNEISLMIMYDYHLWLEAQASNGQFKKHACPDVGLMTPSLYKKEKHTDEDKQIHESLNMPPFQYLSMELQPFIRLMFLPTLLFSLPAKIK